MDQSQYLATKKKAETLHYTQPFTLESTAIVDRLITDVMRVSEKYAQIKKSFEETGQELSRQKQSVQPISFENEKLTKENNQLHMEIIKIKEEYSTKESNWRTSVTTLEENKTDLKFVIELKDTKIRELEKECMNLKEKLNQTLAKIYCPSQNELNKRPKGTPIEPTNLVLQSQKFYVSKPLEGQELPSIPKESAQWLEELKKADERTQKYRKDVEDLNKKLKNLEIEKTDYIAKMENRENEIKRLQELYSPEQNKDKMTNKYISSSNEITLNKLNSQIDHLNNVNHKLEDELKKIKLSNQAAQHIVTDPDSLHKTIETLQSKNNALQSSIKQCESRIQSLETEKGNIAEQIKSKKLVAIEELEREIQRANDFQTELEALKKDNDSLKVEVSDAAKFKSAYNSNKNAMKESLRSFKEDKDHNLKRVEEMINENSSLKAELTLQRDLLNSEKGKQLTLTKDLEMAQNTLNRIRNESSQRTEECIELRKKITTLEAQILKISNEKNDLKDEITKINKMKKMLEEKCDSFKQETLKNNVGIVNEQMGRMEALYNGAKQEIDHLKNEIAELENIIDRNKMELKEADSKAQGYFIEMQALQENVRVLENENKILSNDVSSKFEENRKLSTAKFSLEKDVESLKFYKTQVQQMESKTTKQAESNIAAENEKSGLKIKLIEANRANEALKMDIQAHIEKEKRLEDDKTKLMNEFKKFDKENTEFNTKIKRIIEVEKTSNAYKEALESEKIKGMSLQKQLNDCQVKVKGLEFEVSKLSQNIEILKAHNTRLEEELALKAEGLIKLEQQISDKQGMHMMSTHQLGQAEVEIVDIKNKLIEFEKEKHRLEEDLKTSHKEHDAEKLKVSIQAEQINKLKSLLSSIDKTKEELVEKLRQATITKKDSESDFGKAQQQLVALNQIIKGKDATIASLKESIKNYDANIDDLHNQMDNKAEQISNLQKQLDMDARAVDEIKSKSMMIESKETNAAKQLVDRERELLQLQANYAAIEKTLNSTKEELYIKSKENEKMAEDIENLTRSHQALNNELIQIAEQNKKLAKFGEENLAKAKENQESSHVLQLEKDDIIGNYKTVCNENERLAESMKALLADNKSLFSKIQYADQELEAMRKHINLISEENKEKDSALRAYQQQVTNLSQQLEKANDNLHNLERTKGLLAQDIENTKNLSYTFEATKEEFGKAMAKLEAEKSEKDSELATLSKKCEMLKEEIDSLNIKCNDLELVLSKERTTQHEQYLKIQKLESEKLDISNELAKKKVEINSFAARQHQAEKSDKKKEP